MSGLQPDDCAVDFVGERGEPIGDGAIAESAGMVQRLRLDRELADPLGGVGRGERQFGRVTFHPLRGHQARVGEYPLRLVQGDVGARVLRRVDQHAFGLQGAAQGGVGPCQQQPRWQPPGQRRLRGQRRQRLLERADRRRKVSAVGGDQAGRDRGDGPRKELPGR